VHDFSNKDLTAVPESIFFCLFDPTAPVIETLLLNNNKLPEVPHVLWKLPALKVLNFSHNQLRYLPDTLGMSISQKFFFPIIPSIFAMFGLCAHSFKGACSKLLELDASHNQVEEIPAAFSSLTGLHSLYVSHFITSRGALMRLSSLFSPQISLTQSNQRGSSCDWKSHSSRASESE
jgi:Leucine-rich repeat (LRR) protein